ncbi:unnamed protein product [Bathycoccus prasinos]
MNAIGLTSVTPEFVHKVLQADEVHPKNPAGALIGNEFATFSGFEIAASRRLSLIKMINGVEEVLILLFAAFSHIRIPDYGVIIV